MDDQPARQPVTDGQIDAAIRFLAVAFSLEGRHMIDPKTGATHLDADDPRSEDPDMAEYRQSVDEFLSDGEPPVTEFPVETMPNQGGLGGTADFMARYRDRDGDAEYPAHPEPRSVAEDASTRTGVYLGERRDV